MLEKLTSKIGSIINKVSGKNSISEYDIKFILKEFRKTLLEADVSWSVTKFLLDKIRVRLNDAEITKKISPRDVFNKIVIDEFINIFNYSLINDYNKLFNVFSLKIILFIGLQGVGKTTSLIKLANFIFSNNNKSVLVVSCDVYRPAAIEQLKILSDKVKIDCFLDFDLSDSPHLILRKALDYARANMYDFLIIDSAGRSHIDSFMMNELIELYSFIKPDFTFLVVDSMVGQDGVKSANVFCESVNVSGFFLTKMDGDAKGGVLLSLSFITKKPIYFIGLGEKVDDITCFYPDRIVSRILGFGDLRSLLDDINKKIDYTDLPVKDGYVSFNLNLFKKHLKSIVDLGGMSGLVDKFPGGFNIDKSSLNKFDNKFFFKMIAIIDSMTINERNFPSLINNSRKKRIALGAGVNICDVSKMLKYHNKMYKLFSKIDGDKISLDFVKKKFF